MGDDCATSSVSDDEAAQLLVTKRTSPERASLSTVGI